VNPNCSGSSAESNWFKKGPARVFDSIPVDGDGYLQNGIQECQQHYHRKKCREEIHPHVYDCSYSLIRLTKLNQQRMRIVQSQLQIDPRRWQPQCFLSHSTARNDYSAGK
jgi:hypothetical protein